MAEIEQRVFRRAVEAGHDPILFGCLVQQESGFDPRAYRSEPQIMDASYGLVQILYGTARGIGYTGSPEGLYDVDTNLLYGMKYFRFCLDAHEGHPMWALAAYNAGIGGTLTVRGAEGDDAWKSYNHPTAVLRHHPVVMEKMSYNQEDIEVAMLVRDLGGNASSVLGWINEIGALQARVAELEANPPTPDHTERAKELGQQIIERGRTLELRRLLVETRLRIAREVQQLGQAVQGL
jgi:hypothetical protein